MIAASRYNAARSGSLWLLDDLPPRLRAAGSPDSEGFAAEVRIFQASHGLPTDGKLGPVTWALLSAEIDFPEFEQTQDPTIFESDHTVDNVDDAFRRVREGFKLSPHLAGLAAFYVDALAGELDPLGARALYQAMRFDGQSVAARIQRGKNGRPIADAVRAYQYKGRTAEQMKQSYSSKWHKWIDGSRRSGMGIHWTAGTGGAYQAARYLLYNKPGRVSSNVFIDYDGSCFIVYPTAIDRDIGDDACLFTAHGAHNPGCFGVDFASPGFLERAGSGWRSKAGSRIKTDIISKCGVIELSDLNLKAWKNTPTKSVFWLSRKSEGRVYSVDYFLAPTWSQMASLVVLGRVHSILNNWTADDIVCCGHYQRSDSRADPFYYPLGWVREACLSKASENLLAPGSWLSRFNPADVQDITVDYRQWARSLGW
jgi:hypothetical protein